MKELEDGIEITADPGRGRVLLRGAERPWNDEVLDFLCEIGDSGISARSMIRTLDGDALASWVAELADSYHGWDGVRSWESLEHALRIDAVQERRGHVCLRFVVRGPQSYESDAWEASVCVRLDAGEDMKRLAAEVAAFLA